MSAGGGELHSGAGGQAGRYWQCVVNALSRAVYNVASFADTSCALTAVESAERLDMLITRVTFPEGMPHGVSLALMARRKHPDLKVLFLARQEMVKHTVGVGDVLQTPVLATDVVAKVREMLDGITGWHQASLVSGRPSE
jgi:DNA-binding NtrC family response regulator